LQQSLWQDVTTSLKRKRRKLQHLQEHQLPQHLHKCLLKVQHLMQQLLAATRTLA